MFQGLDVDSGTLGLMLGGESKAFMVGHAWLALLYESYNGLRHVYVLLFVYMCARTAGQGG